MNFLLLKNKRLVISGGPPDGYSETALPGSGYLLVVDVPGRHPDGYSEPTLYAFGSLKSCCVKRLIFRIATLSKHYIVLATV